MTWVVVAAGGAMGSIARHAVNVAFTHLFGRPVPYATAAVNVVGSAAIGLLAGLIAYLIINFIKKIILIILLLIILLLNNFYILILDTVALTHAGDRTLALSNLAGQVVLGILAVYAGYYVGAR